MLELLAFSTLEELAASRAGCASRRSARLGGLAVRERGIGYCRISSVLSLTGRER
ncbi:MAG TPA: hypothetical protein VEF71_20990 [Streptosporangiaceae bacterium]|nr:hypothetical protein [Streptosporangiaceae bacterium]